VVVRGSAGGLWQVHRAVDGRSQGAGDGWTRGAGLADAIPIGNGGGEEKIGTECRSAKDERTNNSITAAPGQTFDD